MIVVVVVVIEMVEVVVAVVAEVVDHASSQGEEEDDDQNANQPKVHRMDLLREGKVIDMVLLLLVVALEVDSHDALVVQHDA